jgi:hypothetical protein
VTARLRGLDRYDPIYRQTAVGLGFGLVIALVLVVILSTSAPIATGPAAFPASPSAVAPPRSPRGSVSGVGTGPVLASRA